MRICTESPPARGSSPEGSFAKDLLRNRRKTSSGIKNLECLTYHTRQKKSQKETRAFAALPCLLETPPGLCPLFAPPPPFSARVARPPGGGQGGWGSPSGPPTDSHPPAPFPLSPAHPRLPNHPQPQHSAQDHCPSSPVHQSCVRVSCVRPAHHNTSFDTFTFIIHPQTAPVPAFHSPVHLTRPPLRRTLCAWSFVSHRFVSRAPSIHHLHIFTAFHIHSPRSLSLKPQRAARAVEDAIV